MWFVGPDLCSQVSSRTPGKFPMFAGSIPIFRFTGGFYYGWLTLKSILHTISIYPQRPKVSPVFLYGPPFSRYKVAENRKFSKCSEWPQTDFEILTVKSTSYSVRNYTRNPNLGPFCSTTSRFRDTRLLKTGDFGNVVNDLRRSEWSQTGCEILTVKPTSYTISNYTRGPNLGPFCCTPAVFWNTRLLKMGNFGNVPNGLRLTLSTER